MEKKTLTRADLSETLHRNIGLSRTESADMVNNVLDLVSDALVEGQSVKLSSFGTFMVRAKRARMGRNPKTGEEVPITPRRVLVFRPSQVMKNVVNGLEPGDVD
jgi:integration host factor subunit alpha